MHDDLTPTPPIALEYGSPLAVDLPPVRRALSFKIAIGCWLIPLLAGVGTFALWLIFRWNSLFLVGWLIVLTGTAAALAGGISVLVLLCTRWSATRNQFRDAVLPAILLWILLASNFAVAFGIATIVFEVSAHND